MNTWEVIKVLLHGANFYWKRFFIFLIVIAVGAAGYAIWKAQGKSEAAVKVATDFGNQSYVDQSQLDVYIGENGKVTAGGNDITQALKILPDYYEVSIIALDNPGVYISSYSIIIHLPADITEDKVEQITYAIHGVGSYQNSMLGPRELFFQVNEISPQATVTVAARLPKDYLKPGQIKAWGYDISQISARANIILALVLPLITLIVLLIMVARRKKDQIFQMSNKAAGGPPDTNAPAVVGVLIDGQLGSREIASTLIDLACRGYIFIIKKGGSFSFGKRKSLNLEEMPELKDFEKVLLSKIFEPEKYKSTRSDVEMRVGKHIFSRKIAQVYLDIYNEATRQGYFIKNPAKVHMAWKYTGIVLFFAGVIAFILTAIWAPDPKFTLIAWIGEMGMAVVIIQLSGLMPTRSVNGTVALRKWLEFRRYLKTPQDVVQGTNIKDEYVKYLPYAVVFGAESEWARRFLDEPFSKPDWYESDEASMTLDTFVGGLYPIISYVGQTLDKSHEPTVE